jgi:hypothetical protein
MAPRRWIYVHCPKTAGISIVSSLPVDLCAYHVSDRHMLAGEIRALYPTLWEECLTIGSVRNPWDRAVSAWAYQKQTIGAPDFEPWLRHTRPLLSQWAMLSDGNRILVDHLIRFEHIQEDFDEAIRLLGAVPCELYHKNKSRHRKVDYQEHYTDELISIVAERYAIDVKRFGYTF